MNKRISFNERDATHIYEWFVGLNAPDLLGKTGCHECTTIVNRLKKLIGAKAVRWVRRQVKRSPYRASNKYVRY